MHYIKPCPACSKKLRFPLDKGKLQIKCECGNVFVADPDDKSLYKDGYFDLSADRSPGLLSGILSKIKKINFRNFYSAVITNLLNYKYSLQNFFLLTWKDRFIIILKTAILAAVLSLLVFLLFYR